MDHAAAHERIEDLVLEPTRLAALGESSDPADHALREHLAGCSVCRADLASWQRLQYRLAAALPGSAEAAAAAVEPIELPPSLRAAVIAAARTAARADERPDDRPVAPTSMVRAGRPGRALVGWLGLAAALVVAAGLYTMDQVSQRTAAQADAQALTTALAAVDRVLGAPEHWVVALRDPAGVTAGSISWSSNDLVVLTTALTAPAAGQEYLCWLREPNGGAVIGKMYFAGHTAYWVGSLDEWATFRIGPDTRFVVTLSPIGGGRQSDPEVLSADLGA